MPLVHTAVGELARTGIDALRGLGFSFALADRMTHILTWSEAVHHCGLKFVRRNETRIRSAAVRRFAVSEAQMDGVAGYVVDANGKSVLESGPRLLDLADAASSDHGLGFVLAERVFGTALLGEIMVRAGERGLCALMLTQGSQTDATEDWSGAILALPDGRIKAARATLRIDPTAKGFEAGQAFAPLAARFAGPAAARIVDFLASTPNPEFASVAILCCGSAGMAHRNCGLETFARLFDDCAHACESCVETDWPNRWRRAIELGFDVECDDWAFLFELVGRTRIPTSERSQAQAG